jgi:tRNA(fMet)-specific endonuclease VapC
VQIVPFDRNAAEAYGELRAKLERKGERLSDPDLMIAAIGLSRSLVVVTGNIKHFGRIEKLKVENWL